MAGLRIGGRSPRFGSGPRDGAEGYILVVRRGPQDATSTACRRCERTSARVQTPEGLVESAEVLRINIAQRKEAEFRLDVVVRMSAEYFRRVGGRERAHVKPAIAYSPSGARRETRIAPLPRRFRPLPGPVRYRSASTLRRSSETLPAVGRTIARDPLRTYDRRTPRQTRSPGETVLRHVRSAHLRCTCAIVATSVRFSFDRSPRRGLPEETSLSRLLDPTRRGRARYSEVVADSQDRRLVVHERPPVDVCDDRERLVGWTSLAKHSRVRQG